MKVTTVATIVRIMAIQIKSRRKNIFANNRCGHRDYNVTILILKEDEYIQAQSEFCMHAANKLGEIKRILFIDTGDIKIKSITF